MYLVNTKTLHNVYIIIVIFLTCTAIPKDVFKLELKN